ncbi:DsbG protein [Corynebacterium kutscheri]|uniref:thioredoxin domain-containing protein n=1 Tax=Corynebacterium kutscheri TaxID=35755 RepID=UPI000F702C25|nr:thioredoxin domain-containing protein [Corynebacterium kutscheri]VEH82432.1 DsbG protein [Corynebacterium kutscheri]
MSNKKVVNPNQKSNGFLWAMVALTVVIAAVVAFIVVNGRQAQENKYADREKETVSFNISTQDNAVVLAASSTTSDTPVVEIFEDYSCSHCADLEEATSAEMKQALEDGKIIAKIYGLNFLDRGNEEGNSTKAGGAAMAVAESGDASAYWNTRKLFMGEQNEIYGQWDNEKFASAAIQMGASEDIRDSIASGDKMREFLSVASANSDYLTEIGERVSSPRVFIDGTEVTSNLAGWVSQATGA